MIRITNFNGRRRGAMLPLAAVLMVFFLGMVAFCVDIGWIVLAQSDLQNAADSAALAGAEGLMANAALYGLPNQSAAQKDALISAGMANARTVAKNFAGYNSAGGVNSLVLNDADIEFGYTDTSGTYTAVPTYTGYPNTVKVVLRRDAQANGSLKLFFAPVIGSKNTDLTATATAAMFAGNFQSLADRGGLLPVAYDVDHWDNFLKTGQDPDGNATLDDNGNPVLVVYPSIKYQGNFGLLSLNDEHVGASDVRSWIDNGMTAADVQQLRDRSLIPLAQHDPTKWDWRGENGLKQSIVSTINDYIGKTFILPLYKAKESSPDYQAGIADYQAGIGQGSWYDYNVVRFVGIKLVLGDNNQVVVQPTAVIDPGAVFDQVPTVVDPTQTGPNLITTYATPKLIR
jgi:Flp pilus assembly protein TadG